MSVSIAVDPSTRENGCLQAIPRSHELGRIEHVPSGDKDRSARILANKP